MAGIKISNLPALPSAALTDLIAEVQPAVGGTTYKATLTQVATAFGFSGGILALANGGTGAALVAANGAIPYSTASAMAFLGPGTSGQILRSGGAGAPTWSTATFPATAGTSGNILISNGTNYISSTSLWPNTVGAAGKIIRSDGTTNAYTTSTFADTYAVSTILYAASSNAVSGLATTNRAALATSATGVPQWLALSDGQLVIGSTAGAPAAANLSAGPGISISSGSNSITISGTGSAAGWTEVTGATQSMVADNGYVTNRATLVTLTLPATAAFGTYLAVVGKGAGGWIIAQNALQTIQVGASTSTAGVGGSVASTNRYDSVEFVCTTANLVWTVLGGPEGSLTIV